MKTVLVVEDNQVNANILSRLLRRDGYEVLRAQTGQEAVDMARTNHPTLVLMDLSLPEMDGWEATRRLKSNRATRDIPVIALTAHDMVEDVQRAVDAGCDHYETKPLQYTRLLKKISELIRR